MKQLLALLLFVPSLCFAQLPDYVPSEGLVAWYPFNGNANDESGNGNDGIITNATLTQDRMGEQNSAFFFDGSGFIEIESLNAMEYNPITYSAWVIDSTEYLDTANFHARTIIGREQSGYYHQGAICYYNEPNIGVSNQPMYYVGNPPVPDVPIANYLFVTSNWTHLAFSLTADGEFSWFVNGDLTNTGTLSVEQYVELPFRIGSSFNRFFWHGVIDDCGIWNRTLNSAEVLALYSGTPPTHGCTNALACNYDPLANSDDGSCVSCEVLASACGEGTVWDTTLQQCVSIVPPCAPSCGEGTVWDPVNEECIIAIPADLNYDGCVTVNDLLELLIVHGTCPPYPEWPVEPVDTAWACGDPLTYWNYDYATVLIGDQCWFAENCRHLPSVSAPSNLGTTELDTLPRAFVYGHSNTTLSEAVATMEYATYGAMYNWAAIELWAICPNGWHLPSDSDWQSLESNMGMTALELNDIGWQRGYEDALGIVLQTNGFQINSVGGFVHHTLGFLGANEQAFYWSSTLDDSNPSIPGPIFHRRFSSSQDGIYRGSDFNQNSGAYIRCMED